MTYELRAGVLGLGNMGQHHVRVLSGLRGVSLVAVADRQGDRYSSVSSADVAVVSSLDELLSVGVDLCVVALPAVDHEAAAVQLASSRVPSLIEKPLADNVESGRNIVEAFKAAGVLACVGHVERYNPAVQELRSLVERGALGRPYQIATRRQGPPPGRVHDVGVVKDLATHDFDLTAWIGGSPYKNLAAQACNRDGGSADDLVAVVGRLENGTVVNHLVNWVSPVTERIVAVTGERGCLEANTAAAGLKFWSHQAAFNQQATASPRQDAHEVSLARYALERTEPLVAELSAFRDAVLGCDAPLVSLNDGLRSLILAEAVLSSAQTGKTITLS